VVAARRAVRATMKLPASRRLVMATGAAAAVLNAAAPAAGRRLTPPRRCRQCGRRDKNGRNPNAQDHRGVRPHRRGERLRVLARATELAAKGRDIINLGIGQPDFRTPDFIVEAAVKGAARRQPRLYAGNRHPAAARGGGGRPPQAVPGERVARIHPYKNSLRILVMRFQAAIN
jgi:hypothetical protein